MAAKPVIWDTMTYLDPLPEIATADSGDYSHELKCRENSWLD
jgi:hypothetical protein